MKVNETNVIFDHQFKARFKKSLCSKNVNITLYKHHLAIFDSGSLVYMTNNGENFEVLQVIELNIDSHQFDYVYSVVVFTSIVLLGSLFFFIYLKFKGYYKI